jgi:hypothetical protein
MTPESTHYGLAERLNENRSIVLRAAFQKNPQPPELPIAVWINKPESENIRA